MKKAERIEKIKAYAAGQFAEDATGHDYEHMKRVAHWAASIAREEEGDPFMCEAAGWLHDVGDRKLTKNPEQALKDRDAFLQSLFFTEKEIEELDASIRDVSFSKGRVPLTRTGKIVQDADRLDAVGAIGIARTFAYGGAHGQPLYAPDGVNDSFSHFEEKLLKLASLMNTETGKREARKRHSFMVQFLEEMRKDIHITDEGVQHHDK
ncbi:HD domain-containing protein [Halobacillus litoralis]|uniref:HD domain-containing protein n=1 Tax=Halobacillus litoralis TaxID=45668 RepID=UPI001CD602D5|nr:HD domain-containing protein [Halobacillus litoralis]MCA1023237.1 HD domain-containing protein [Halobacillus litoralis]